MAGMIRLVGIVALMRLGATHASGRALDHALLKVLPVRCLRANVANPMISMARRLVIVIHLRHPVRHDPQLLLWLVRIVGCQQDSEVVRPLHASMHGELHRKLRLLPRLESRRPDDNAGRSAPFDDFRDRWNGKTQQAIARVAHHKAGLDHLIHGDIPKIDIRPVQSKVWRAIGAGGVGFSALAGLPGQ